MKKFVATAAMAILMSISGFQVAQAQSYKKTSEVQPVVGENFIPVQVIRVQMKNQPMPDENDSLKSVNWAFDYWSKISSNKIQYQLVEDQELIADINQSQYQSTEFGEIVTAAESSGELDQRPEYGIRIFIHNLDYGVSSAYQTADFPGGVVQIHGNKEAIAHELGHALGLGHSKAPVSFAGEDVISNYANGWSIMGGGSGVPDGAQLEELKLIKTTPVKFGKFKLYPVGEFKQKGHHSLKWTDNGKTYGADFRSANFGLDTKPNDDPNAVLYIYRVDKNSGLATINLQKIKNDEERKVGELWFKSEVSKDKKFTTVTVSED